MTPLLLLKDSAAAVDGSAAAVDGSAAAVDGSAAAGDDSAAAVETPLLLLRVMSTKIHIHRTPGRQGALPCLASWRKMTQPGKICW